MACFVTSLSAKGHKREDSSSSDSGSTSNYFTHDIQLQLSDSTGFPVAGTQFWVQLDIVKDGPKVTINVPLINFETGPISTSNPFYPSGEFLPGFPPLGGYLVTATGFLPEHLRPADVIPQTVVAASNNGLSPVFSFTQDPSTLPLPPAGYLVQVTNAGALQIQCAGTFGNIIPVGPQISMPCSITYVAHNREKLHNNVKISRGSVNTTQFTGGPDGAEGTGIRDSHVNDAFDGVVAWAWTDNSNIKDKANNTVNCWVRVGKTDKDGKLKLRDPIQLTNLQPGVFAWDTAVAINRTNKKNIVVSYSVLNAPGTPYRAASFDGGKTWPENGPLNAEAQPTGVPGGNGDNRGVSSDMFGNIWYSTTNEFDDFGNVINQPYFAASQDGGVTFEVVLTVPLPSLPDGTFLYDFPQYCFGGDGLGNYGLWFQTTLYNFETFDGFPNVGFMPIYGLGQFGTPTPLVTLQGLTNDILEMQITASAEGRVWFTGFANDVDVPYTYVIPSTILFKSPGAIDVNYAGPWQYNFSSSPGVLYFDSGVISQPLVGFLRCPQSIIYDDKRQALYALNAAQSPDASQNMRITFTISRDNGQTWSRPIDISTSTFANRGYQSMALDQVKGDLVFGWYDGRHDKTYQSLEYFGAVLPAKTLDKLVKSIPLSNPLFAIPPLTTPPSQ